MYAAYTWTYDKQDNGTGIRDDAFRFTLIKLFLWLLTQGRLRRQYIMTILIRDGAWAYAVIFGQAFISAERMISLTASRYAHCDNDHVQNTAQQSRVCVLSVSRRYHPDDESDD